MVGQTNINTCKVSERNNQNVMYKSRSKIVSKLLKNCLIQDNVYGHTYIFGLEYRVTSLIIFHFVVPGMNIQKSDQSDN